MKMTTCKTTKTVQSETAKFLGNQRNVRNKNMINQMCANHHSNRDINQYQSLCENNHSGSNINQYQSFCERVDKLDMTWLSFCRMLEVSSCPDWLRCKS